MPYEYEVGEDLSTGGTFLQVEGRYHLVIESVDDPPLNKDGQIIANALFRVNMKVLNGTAPGQGNKSIEETFFAPRADGNDGGKFARKKIDRLLLSAGLIKPEFAGKKINVEWAWLKGKQIVAEFHKEKGNNNKEYLRLAYAEIYHVDDPEVADVPKDQTALAAIPKEFRRIGQQSTSAVASQKEQAKSTGVNLDDV